MARKRTPTKERHGRDGQQSQDKHNTKKMQDQNSPKLTPRISPIMLLSVFVSVFTVAVCYIIYPELTSLSIVNRKSVPSLRTFIEPIENSHISEKGNAQNMAQNNFLPIINAAFPSSLDTVKAIRGADADESQQVAEEVAKLFDLTESVVEKTDSVLYKMPLPAKLKTGIENGRSFTNNDTAGLDNLEEVSGNIPTGKSGLDVASEDKPSRSEATLGIRSQLVDTKSFKDFPKLKNTNSEHNSDQKQDENLNDEVTKVLRTTDSQKDKNNEAKSFISISKPEDAGVPIKLVPREGKKKKSGPIILSAENPHVQLDFDDMNSAKAPKQKKETATRQTQAQMSNKNFSDQKLTKKKSEPKFSARDDSNLGHNNGKLLKLNNGAKGLKVEDSHKNNKAKQSISINSEAQNAGTRVKIPPRDGKKRKSAPIILSAENPHVQLNLNEIKSEKGPQQGEKTKTRQTQEQMSNKKSLNPKREELVGTSGSKKSINQRTAQTKKTDKGSVPSGNTDHLSRDSNKPQKKPTQKPAKVEIKKKSKSNTDRKSKEKLASSDLNKESNTEFTPTFQRTFSPFYGGRRIAPVELLHQKSSNSSVKVYLFDDFLSEQECDGLMRAHDSHVRAYTKPPILCFDSIKTLRKHIQDAGKRITVTPRVFTTGTKCVNTSFSLQLQTWLNSNWSYSTAFYPGESKFSTNIAERMQKAMGLKPENGGKFQITSYPVGKAYKTHTDCTLGGVDQRDRVVSVLMYLNDAEEGGETKFPELGIWVKPKRGRAIVWNNMSPRGLCEHHSRHTASLVKQGKKYILIRWYYYKSFPGLSHRPSPPGLPSREQDQAMVSCDDYNSGSCRWYDEWTYDHLIEYQKNKLHIS